MGAGNQSSGIEPFEIRGDAVALVPLAPSDAEDVTAAVQDPDIARWTTVPTPYSLTDGQWWTGHADDEWARGVPHWAIRSARTGEFLGAITLFHRGRDTYEVGYWMAARHRGHGYMSEAVRLATTAAFDRLGARRVQWKAKVGNWGSWKSVWRNGFRREGTLRGLTDERGEVADHWSAAIVRGDPMQPASPWDGPAPTRK